MKKVYVICTGGTIGMQDSDEAQTQEPAKFEDEIKKILSPLKNFPEIKLNVYSPQLDSSEVTIAQWNKIAIDIRENYEFYDGFVVLHGTDTMAYTGSALSYMFDNLRKPIILTGAQTPLSCVVNDARENLINAIYIAGKFSIYEVCIYFNQSLFRANRTTKYSTINYDAYISPNYPPLGKIGSRITIDTGFLLPPPVTENVYLTTLEYFDVRFIFLTPNMEPDVFSRLIQGAKAAIIGTYGDGNMRIQDEKFLEVIRKENEKGTIIINKSQCLNSRTFPQYAAGEVLQKAGIISAGDQTVESIVCKLLYLFSAKLPKEKIEKLVQMNIRGELTNGTSQTARYGFFRINHGSTYKSNSDGSFGDQLRAKL